MNAYIERIIDSVKKRDANEPEFIQTVEEVLRKDMQRYQLNLTEFAVLELLYHKGDQPIQYHGWMIKVKFMLTEDTEFSLTELSDLTKVD